jgi:hypothetical protein
MRIVSELELEFGSRKLDAFTVLFEGIPKYHAREGLSVAWGKVIHSGCLYIILHSNRSVPRSSNLSPALAVAEFWIAGTPKGEFLIRSERAKQLS